MCDKRDPLQPSHVKARVRENVDADAHGRSSDQQQHCRETYIFVVHDLVSFASEAMSGWFEASNAAIFLLSFPHLRVACFEYAIGHVMSSSRALGVRTHVVWEIKQMSRQQEENKLPLRRSAR
jgi:hypothetical protein